ncbi:MAG TPA: acyltransferase [Candidatus Dormibacteraeota bacterium]|jgi:acetyltransferase-like isoleucine patch superfamily enzyme|nr:acyltransferase [Candidatus Dormibacteraeota bacterium]
MPRIKVRGSGGVEVESCTLYPGVRLECIDAGRILIGKGTYLNRRTEVIAQEKVRIGRDCAIAWDVVIMDTDQHGLDGGPAIPRPVNIGDGVWIGCRAVILKGVTIGDGAIVGAGAVVTHPVPPGAVVTGPAAAMLRPSRRRDVD